MFVAWRDLRFARGRFALVVTVVALVTVLVVLLSGLTEGLGRDSTSLVTGLRADRIVLADPGSDTKSSFATSGLSGEQLAGWTGEAGVGRAEPIGLSTLRIRGERAGTVTVVGVPTGSGLAPSSGVRPGTAVLSGGASHELCDDACSTVQVGGQTLAVSATAGDVTYSHTPVVWIALTDWQALPGASGEATALAVTSSTIDWDAADTRWATVSATLDRARDWVPSYSSEHGSLQMMRGLLFAVSALVVGAFFTVWTMQRTGDVAVLKAIGAGTRQVLGDALAQAALVLVFGVGVGSAAAAGVGLAVRDVVPVVIDVRTLAVPVVVTVALGLVGAALSVLRVTRVDPLLALGAAR